MKRLFKIIPLMITPLVLTSCFVPIIFGSSSEEPYTPSYEPASYSYDENADYNVLPSLYKYRDYMEGNYFYLGSAPSTGEASLLVVPIWFTDSSTYISNKNNVRSDIQKAYFGTSSETGWHSVKSYYETESRGRLIIDGTVTDWYECGKASSKFYTEDTGADATISLIDDVTAWYKKKYNVKDLTNFDKDKDGYVDSLMLIYAAPDYQAMDSSAANLWAYCYWKQEPSDRKVSDPGVNQFFWASYDFMYGSNRALLRTGKSSYYNGDTRYCSVDAHTYIHEMGHIFGLEDYYDYYTKTEYKPAAGFSMQDYNVGAHDPYSKFALGWADAIVPQRSCSLTLKPIESSGQFVLLTPSSDTSKVSAFDEYIILELYTATGLNEFDSKYKYSGGYPQGPKASGVRVWHVDSRLLAIKSSSDSKFYGTLTNNPYDKSAYQGVTHATSNSGGGDYGSNYAGSYDYNILQLIRNSVTETYKSKNELSSNDLFREGDSFRMSTYSSQFVNGSKLNSNKQLGWEVNFGAISNEGISLTIVKG